MNLQLSERYQHSKNMQEKAKQGKTPSELNKIIQERKNPTEQTSGMKSVFLITCLLAVTTSVLSFTLGDLRAKLAKLNPFSKLNFDPKPVRELVTRHGYPYEEYDVETEDGFILKMHRIPYGKNTNCTTRHALILQHGVMCSSGCWVLSEPSQGLGFILADACYDVWMGNNRGTYYGRNHTKLDPYKDQDKYYDFSFHELGMYDMPAMIDFVLAQTGQKKLHYVGHSQGTTQFFVMASMRPEYNDKIKVMNAMAPIASLKHTRGFVKFSAIAQPLFNIYFDFKGNGDMLAPNVMTHSITKAICDTKVLAAPLCENMLFIVGGFNAQQMNSSLMPEILEQSPTGSSIKQMRHFSQLTTNGGKFCMFDYGRIRNLLIYKSATPTEYPVEKITTHIILHYSGNDFISSAEDVEEFAERLPSVELDKVPMEMFTHLDYMWAIDARSILYDPMIKKMKEYDNID